MAAYLAEAMALSCVTKIHAVFVEFGMGALIACGYKDHADIVAAKNMVATGLAMLANPAI